MIVSERVLGIWFGSWSDDEPIPEGGPPQYALWWRKNDQTDDRLREELGKANAAARRGELDHWTETAEGTIALVILLDQISRNIHRGTAEMFSADAQARRIVHRALDTGVDRAMPLIHRYFLYMPLMHSEDLADHALGTERFTDLAEAAKNTARAGNYAGASTYMDKHRAIIERFGRYPHRNALLGRETTTEEEAFLTQPGSSF